MMLSAPVADMAIATTSAATTTPAQIRAEDGDRHDSGGEEHEGDRERTLEISVPEL
jgi:hypothetical protein